MDLGTEGHGADGLLVLVYSNYFFQEHRLILNRLMQSLFLKVILKSHLDIFGHEIANVLVHPYVLFLIEPVHCQF